MEKKQFIDRLAELRLEKGVSAREMSLSIGQSAGYINNIENGVNFPSMTIFFYICDYLDITPREFFDTDTKFPQQLDQLIANLVKLDERQLNHIAALVEDLILK